MDWGWKSSALSIRLVVIQWFLFYSTFTIPHKNNFLFMPEINRISVLKKVFWILVYAVNWFNIFFFWCLKWSTFDTMAYNYCRTSYWVYLRFFPSLLAFLLLFQKVLGTRTKNWLGYKLEITLSVVLYEWIETFDQNFKLMSSRVF